MLSCSEDLPREAVRVPLRAAGAGVVPRGWRELRPSVRRVVVRGNEVEWDGLLLATLLPLATDDTRKRMTATTNTDEVDEGDEEDDDYVSLAI